MRHDLKTHPGPFQAVWDGRKTFEIRKFDRPFAVGDVLLLREWDPDGGYLVEYPPFLSGRLTGRFVVAAVPYLTKPGAWDLPPDIGVLGIRVLEKGGA